MTQPDLSSLALPDSPAALTDEQLDVAYDCALADYCLAVKYEHNAHLRPAIEAHLGILDDEYKRRGTQYRFPGLLSGSSRGEE